MFWPLLIITGLYGWTAYNDYTRRKVPDLLSGAVWIVTALLFPSQFWLAGLAFGCLILGGTGYVIKFGKPCMAWGDLLTFAPLFPVFYATIGWILTLVTIGSSFVIVDLFYLLIAKEERKEKGVPLTVGMFAALVALCLMGL